MSLWQFGLIGGLLMMAAGLCLLGWLAFYRQAPPIDGRGEPSWLKDSGEHPYVGQRRMAPPVGALPPGDPVQDLTLLDSADETWSWAPAPPAHHRWEHLQERTRPLRPPTPPIE